MFSEVHPTYAGLSGYDDIITLKDRLEIVAYNGCKITREIEHVIVVYSCKLAWRSNESTARTPQLIAAELV